MKTEKQCTLCEVVKPITEFSVSKQGVKGPIYRSRCKTCNSGNALDWYRSNRQQHKNTKHEHTLRTLYGLTIERYMEMHDAQNGLCAVCGLAETRTHGRTGTLYRLVVDHCHKTGRIRGLLCQVCNRGIGLLGDDAQSLRKAVEYLERE